MFTICPEMILGEKVIKERKKAITSHQKISPLTTIRLLNFSKQPSPFKTESSLLLSTQICTFRVTLPMKSCYDLPRRETVDTHFHTPETHPRRTPLWHAPYKYTSYTDRPSPTSIPPSPLAGSDKHDLRPQGTEWRWSEEEFPRLVLPRLVPFLHCCPCFTIRKIHLRYWSTGEHGGPVVKTPCS